MFHGTLMEVDFSLKIGAGWVDGRLTETHVTSRPETILPEV